MSKGGKGELLINFYEIYGKEKQDNMWDKL